VNEIAAWGENPLLSLVLFVLVVAASVLVASRFRPDTWYRRLRKPAWNPPNWVFAPVWTVLYVCIAVAGWLAWRDGANQWSLPLYFWIAQLVCNVAWSWLFFGLHNIGGALAVSGMLLVAIVGFIVTALYTGPWAAALFVPYALWVAFATLLNAAVWRIRRSDRRVRTLRVNPH
jgi:tryptophan-rich sensory protein